jgi:hypothetical protein
MAGLYMGPSSAFAGAFGGQPTPPNPIGPPGGQYTQQGSNKPGLPGGKIPIGPVGPPSGPQGQGGSGFPQSPIRTGGPVVAGQFSNNAIPGGNQPTPANPTPPLGSVLPAQAVRASGPSKGFDPAFLQNLATSIGGLFSGGSNGVMNVNPLGNLSEISGPSGMEGNAPQQGLPQTWLQQALNGLGFNFASPTATSTIPKVPSVGNLNNDGGGRGPRQYA